MYKKKSYNNEKLSMEKMYVHDTELFVAINWEYQKSLGKSQKVWGNKMISLIFPVDIYICYSSFGCWNCLSLNPVSHKGRVVCTLSSEMRHPLVHFRVKLSLL